MNSLVVDRPVARFRRRDSNDELARINRLTGLAFESVPRSLLGTANPSADSAQGDTQETCVVLAWKKRLRPAS